MVQPWLIERTETGENGMHLDSMITRTNAFLDQKGSNNCKDSNNREFESGGYNTPLHLELDT